MKKYQKVLLIASACLVVGGGIMGVAGIAMGGMPGFVITEEGVRTTQDRKGKYVEKKAALKDISSLDIDCEDGEIEFVSDSEFYVEYGYDDVYYRMKEEKKNGTYHLTSRYTDSMRVTGVKFFWGNDITNSKEPYVRIHMPPKTRLENLTLNCEYGKIKIDMDQIEAKNTKISMESGNFQVRGIKGEKAEIEIEYADMELKECEMANLDVVNEGGKSCLSDISTEKMKVETEYGKLSLTQIAGNTVMVSCESGMISLNHLTGEELSITNYYDGIEMEDVTANTFIHLRNESGSIRMHKVKTGQIELENESGDVEGSEVEIKTGQMVTDYGNFKISGFTAKDVTVTNEDGEIDLEMMGKEEDYSMSMQTEYGEILLNGKSRGTDMTMEREKAKNKLKLMTESGNISVKTQ